MRYFLKLAYDGSDFHGWQRQPNAPSVQEKIEAALSTILRVDTPIVGAGRTDAGVHAQMMYAHFDSNAIEDESRFLTSLNRMVGNQISIDGIFPVVPEAHARFDALSRSYVYRISIGKDPFDFYFSHRLDRLPDLDRMNEAAAILLDTDDFTSFAKLHTDVKTNICKVSDAVWRYDPSSRKLSFTITADRFLRNMVRAIVGTLLEVGTGKLTIPGFRMVIDKKNRSSAGVSMPAKGLSLFNIIYPEEIFLK